MWIGELITERGIGNGISFIIFAGIVASSRSGLAVFLRTRTWPRASRSRPSASSRSRAIVYIQEGQRRIPIQYASRVRGRRMYQGGATFLPLRVNQAGVIPIIFAISILLFPVQLATLLPGFERRLRPGHVARRSSASSTSTQPLYVVLYFLLTVGFTYFYTAFTFKPDETADQLRKNGGFIPGIRRCPDARLPREGGLPHQPRRRHLPGHRGRAPDHRGQPFFTAASWARSAWAARPCSSSSPWSWRP